MPDCVMRFYLIVGVVGRHGIVAIAIAILIVLTWPAPYNDLVELALGEHHLMRVANQCTRSFRCPIRLGHYLDAAAGFLLNAIDLLNLVKFTWLCLIAQTSPFLPMIRPTSWSGTLNVSVMGP